MARRMGWSVVESPHHVIDNLKSGFQLAHGDRRPSSVRWNRAVADGPRHRRERPRRPRRLRSGLLAGLLISLAVGLVAVFVLD